MEEGMELKGEGKKNEVEEHHKGVSSRGAIEVPNERSVDYKPAVNGYREHPTTNPNHRGEERKGCERGEGGHGGGRFRCTLCRAACATVDMLSVHTAMTHLRRLCVCAAPGCTFYALEMHELSRHTVLAHGAASLWGAKGVYLLPGG